LRIIIIPTDELICFKMVKTTNQCRYNIQYIYIYSFNGSFPMIFRYFRIAIY
jgi:hypothetical protein